MLLFSVKLSVAYDSVYIAPLKGDQPAGGSVASGYTGKSTEVNSSAASTSGSAKSPKRSESASDKPTPAPRRSTGDGGSNMSATVETSPV